MKMKQAEENKEKNGLISKELEKAFNDLLAFEAKKLSFIYSAKLYMDYNGLVNYYKFFCHVFKSCEDTIHCIIHYLTSRMCKVQELTFPAMDYTIESPESAFEQLASYEDGFEDVLYDMLDKANEDGDWNSVMYLGQKLDKIDHICCKAYAAVQNKQNPLDLIKCEQPSK